MNLYFKLYIIFFIIISFFSSIFSQNINSFTLDNHESIEKLPDLFVGITTKCNHLSLICEIKSDQHTIRLQADTYFYILDGKQFKIEEPAIYNNGLLYITKDFLTHISNILNMISIINRKSIDSNEEQNTNKILIESVPLKDDSLSLTKKEEIQNTNVKQNKELSFIILDAGHGGKDPGAKGFRGISEKQITLEVSKYVHEKLVDAFPNTDIILTRKTDVFLELDTRSNIANKIQVKNNFGLFLSLHCNAIFTPSTRGFEIYYLADKPNNEEARRTMIRENHTFSSTPYVRKFESYLISDRIQRESKTLANQFHKSFLKHLHILIPSRGVRRADFSVLREIAMPGLLIELGYLTNPKESEIMQTNLFYEKLSSAIITGIRLFLQEQDQNYIINKEE